MLDQNNIKKIKDFTETFFQKMTIDTLRIDVNFSSQSNNKQTEIENKEVVNLDVKLSEPQVLIGEKGQTLFEIQRIIRMALNKKLQEIFYLNLDINDYKKKKIEYLKSLAKEIADEVALSKKEKALLPMSSYERRIIHAELSERQDVDTESRGEGFERHLVIKPK